MLLQLHQHVPTPPSPLPSKSYYYKHSLPLVHSSVFQHMLEQHLRVCNAREPKHLPYYVKNCNAGSLHENQPLDCVTTLECVPLDLGARTVANLTDDELLALVDCVLKLEEGKTIMFSYLKKIRQLLSLNLMM